MTAAANPHSLRVATWNVAGDIADQNSAIEYAKSKGKTTFDTLDEGQKKTHYRALLAEKVHQLTAAQPDVICFQDIMAEKENLKFLLTAEDYQVVKISKTYAVFVKKGLLHKEISDNDEGFIISVKKGNKTILIEDSYIGFGDNLSLTQSFTNLTNQAESYDYCILAGDLNADRRLAKSDQTPDLQKATSQIIKASKSLGFVAAKSSATNVSPLSGQEAQLDQVMVKAKLGLLSRISKFFWGLFNYNLKTDVKVVDVGPSAIRASYAEPKESLDGMLNRFDFRTEPSDHRMLVVDVDLTGPKLVQRRLKPPAVDEFEYMLRANEYKKIASIADKLNIDQFTKIAKNESVLKLIPPRLFAKMSDDKLQKIAFTHLDKNQVQALTSNQIVDASKETLDALSSASDKLSMAQIQAICYRDDFDHLLIRNTLKIDQIKEALASPTRFSYKLFSTEQGKKILEEKNRTFPQNLILWSDFFKILAKGTAIKYNEGEIDYKSIEYKIQTFKELFGNGALLLPEHMEFFFPDGKTTPERTANFKLLFPDRSKLSVLVSGNQILDEVYGS